MLGAGLLASAGVISIVAGLAIQTSLVMFAGMQLAFIDAIRVDDVVVHIWDDRRLILPSTYFTTTPFENWPQGTDLP